MKVFYINGVSYGSTGRIMFQLADAVKKEGGDALCTAGYTWNKSTRDDFFITSRLLEKKLHAEISKITGKHGGYSRISTRILIDKIKAFNPDIIHLHNIHGWFLNFEMLFSFLKNYFLKDKSKKLIWTFHDCWSFTGYCPHFDMSGCEKWKTGCFDCSYSGYPKTYFDNSKKQYKRKKELFSNLEGLTIVTPSLWLKSKVEESFLSTYHSVVINNGVDLSVFSPLEKSKKLEIRKKHGINTKHMVLGVSYGWDEKKGLDTFLKLSESLGNDYTVVLVGTDKASKEIIKKASERIVCIDRTQNQKELAELYSASDVFVNPTLEDTFPTVNMEALACGTPVITYATGGSGEIPDKTCGIAVNKKNYKQLENHIRYVCENSPFSEEACVKRSKAFDKNVFTEKYMALYKSVISQ